MGQLSSKPSGSSRSRYGNPKSTSQLGRGGSTPSAGYFNFVSPHSTINNILRPEDKKKKPPVSGNGKNGSKPKLNKLKGVASNDRTNHKPEHKSRNENADSSRASKSKHAKQKKARSNSSSTQHGLHKRPPRPKEKKECIVCTDSRSLHRFPIRPPTTQCTHGVDVCRRCLRAWITSEFATKIWDEINCPICPTRMQHMDMQEFAPRGIFRRYDELSMRAALEAIPNFRWCMAKNCKSGQVQPPNIAKFRCMACKSTHCTKHNIVHKRESCREYEYRTNRKLKKAEELASQKWIAESTKKCPGCKKNIEKSYGCDHMTCSRCREEFCWQCLVSFKNRQRGRVVHKPGCDYFTPVVQVEV